MLDKKRIFAKIDSLDGYLDELGKIKPETIEEYCGKIEKRRACERLLQISTEAVIDICSILVSGLGLGLPSDEETMVDKLEKKKVITTKMKSILKGMIGFRNVLVHKYGEVNDKKVFENLSRFADFEMFKEEVAQFLANQKNDAHPCL